MSPAYFSFQCICRQVTNFNLTRLINIFRNRVAIPISSFICKLPQGLISWGSLFIILLSIAIVYVRGDITGLYINLFGKWIDSVYLYLLERPVLNYLITITFVIIGSKQAVSTYKSKSISVLLASISIIALVFVNSWPGNYLLICWPFTYKWLFNILFSVLLGIECIHLIRNTCRKEPKILNDGLLIKSPQYLSDGRTIYAETIADLIIKSPIKEKSFAIGIVGEWGSGKTLVLSEIAKILKNKAIVIQFKPWNSKSPEHLIDDFFSVLREGISHNNRNISCIIAKYAAHIIDFDINGSLNSIAKLSSIISKELVTLDSLKNNVENILVNLEKNVVILIDDLDRLDSNELFETMRLVRNTADFKNVCYVVTFDKEYVSHMLESKGIVNSERYLEKIFTTTVSLPSYEPYLLVLLIYNELSKRYGSESIEFRGLSNYITQVWTHKSTYILNDYINTFRDAIRFSNHIIQELEILKRNTPTYFRDLNMREWFFLEVIKFSYPEVYQRLHNFPNEYLEIYYNSSQGFVRLKSGSKDDENSKNPLPLTRLLTLLFSYGNQQFKPNSIVYEHNYYNYFALRVLSTEIKQSEFNNLIEDTALDIECILRIWRNKNPSVYKSVAAHFTNYIKRDCDKTQGTRFIKAMVKWSSLSQDSKMLSVIRNITYYEFNKNIQRDICNSFYDELKISLPLVQSLEFACQLAMASAPVPIDPNEDPDNQGGNLLSRERAEVLAKIILIV